MKSIGLLAMAASTVCWYWTSSVNAIATQRLLRHILGAEDAPPTSVPVLALWLSTCQLALGALLSVPFLLMSCRAASGTVSEAGSGTSNGKAVGSVVGNSLRSLVTRQSLVVGWLHCFGCICTNVGFGYGSASLVQVIKLLEPLETLLLSGLAAYLTSRSTSSFLSAKKVLATLTIMGGTSLLLAQKSMDTNARSIAFAVASGFCMALRNVIQKSIKRSSEKTEQSPPAANSCTAVFLQGMTNFARITVLAFLPALLLTLLAIFVNALPVSALLSFLSNASAVCISNLHRAVLFHCLYNIFSITVLSLTSAPVHSLLNVGKRIANVLAAAVVFGVPLTYAGKLGLIIAASGALLYNDAASQSITKWLCNAPVQFTTSKRFFYGMVICFVLCLSSLQVINDANGYFSTLSTIHGSSQHYSSKAKTVAWSTNVAPMTMTTLDTLSTWKKFVVWTYPFPPPDHSWNVESNEVLICPYRSACPTGRTLNLAQLAMGTFYENYILDHSYHKFRHYKDFCHHVQAIAMISLLIKQPGACVRTLGGKTKFCDSNAFNSYNPYLDYNYTSDLSLTKFPFQILQHHPHAVLEKGITSNSNNDDNPIVDNEIIASIIPLAPKLTMESFATYGKYNFDDQNSYPVGRYNSGEDIQSMAGAGWMPFLSSIRDKVRPMENYTGYYIANSLQSGEGMKFPYDPSNVEKQRHQMEHTELLSIFMAEQRMISINLDFLKDYTENIYPFGCRSTLTCQRLKENQIKSYFSACLTLTTTYQGGTLQSNDYSPSLNSMDILEPTVNSSAALQHVEKDLILMIDVTDTSVVPKEVRQRARVLTADIPRTYPLDYLSEMGRIQYCYRLLSQYKNYAKVVITSRIHVGLPASSLGVPVIFVSKGGWLPGGHERSGRVSGLLEVFHRVDEKRGMEWTFGDLTDPVPPNPGNHYADRFRASFWNRMRRIGYYHDAAKLFGRVPLQRLGAKMERTDIQQKFHFIMNQKDLYDWATRRAVETVFYFHPNAKVYVHVALSHANDELEDEGNFVVLVESGYDLSVQTFDPESLAKDITDPIVDSESIKNLPVQASVLLWTYGGVYLSKNTYLQGELSSSLDMGYSQRNNELQMMISEKKSNELLKSILSNKDNHLRLKSPSSPSANSTMSFWEVSTLSEVDTGLCMEAKEWKIPSKETFLAVSVDSAVLHKNTILVDTECYQLIEMNCIYCDELYWEYELKGKDKVSIS